MRESREFEILGHPIQLHHVLLAVERNKDGDNVEYEAALANSVLSHYDLTQDAENQSEKFYTLINKIL